MPLTVQNLFEHDFWWNCLKFYDKRHLPIQMRIIYIYNVKTQLCNSFETLTSLIKLMFEAEDSIRSTIKKSLLLYCRKFSAFAVAVII